MPDTLLSLLPAGLSVPDYLSMGALILAGACLQGVGGIGFAMLSAPLGAIFFPDLVPGPLLAMGCCLSLMGALREREAIVWNIAGFALAGRALGGAAAVLTIAWLAPGPLAVLFSLSILAAVALSLLGWRLLPSSRNVVVAGTLSGFMGTITSAGAPPFALVMQHMAPAPMRATMGTILSGGAVLSLSMLALAGRFGLPQLMLALVLAPFLLAGFVLSNRLRGRVSPTAVRRLLLGLCAAGALGVLGRAAFA
ncbi:sulfite exporter TauE/SafE family protein [Cupriavidus sp. P-10]|uniref:sulfite exporter TauE/SafE family protein n=1 Tax=Cupriavidus sp. P-10 TaxID=2027911 RepID=UPI000ED457A7|nr:sulfite exporter TauE/SafE family protein [Cupriavidus sp. P-10]